MTRIISRSGAPGARSALPRDWRTQAPELEQAQAPGRAAQILLQARQQARAITQAAEDAAQATLEAARQAGHQHGYAAGVQQALQQNAAVAQRLAMIAAAACAAHEASARNLDHELASLALVLARAIVRREISVAPDTVLAVARAAIAQILVEHTVTLRVHADDAPLLSSQIPALGLPESVHVSVVEDAFVAPGGCIVESGAGRIDATVDAQFDRLERLIREQLDAPSA